MNNNSSSVYSNKSNHYNYDCDYGYNTERFHNNNYEKRFRQIPPLDKIWRKSRSTHFESSQHMPIAGDVSFRTHHNNRESLRQENVRVKAYSEFNPTQRKKTELQKKTFGEVFRQAENLTFFSDHASSEYETVALVETRERSQEELQKILTGLLKKQTSLKNLLELASNPILILDDKSYPVSLNSYHWSILFKKIADFKEKSKMGTIKNGFYLEKLHILENKFVACLKQSSYLEPSMIANWPCCVIGLRKD
jgi:transcriptional regulator with PAS, ATPase and Fis domain